MTVPVAVIGGGAAGLCAALALRDAGVEVLVIEADAVPMGSTALSAGLIPAAGTPQQASFGIDDTAALFAKDIQAKAKGQNDPALVNALAEASGSTLSWLCEAQDMPFSLVDDFDYPGHSRRRMHGLPDRSGRALVDMLRSRAEQAGADILTGHRAETLHHADGLIVGASLRGLDGASTQLGFRSLILACNGFGGNRAMVAQHMPEISSAVWFGHDGNRGEAVAWGTSLGAATKHLGAYQGHGNVAHPHGILVTWATIIEGGIQVNRKGARFWDESQGYSEAARVVLAQPGGTVWTLFDARIANVARQFEDFRLAEAQGAIRHAQDLSVLAQKTGLPEAALRRTLQAIPRGSDPDAFGRVFAGPRLSAPFCAVQVTGALFHTQGGLVTDGKGRVQHTDGTPFQNLWAAGGATCGVSGAGDAGYLSGNGLLSAVVLGLAAGRAAAGQSA